jgi:hypothetical protein
MFVIAAVTAAAARQYYIIARIERGQTLGLRGIEAYLIAGAAPIVVNTTEFIHGIDWSETTRRSNSLTAIVVVVWLALLLLFLYVMLSPT